MTDFMDSLTRKLSPKKALEHSAFLTKEGHLIVSEPTVNEGS